MSNNENLQDKFLAVEADLNEVVLNRGPEIRSALLCLISENHMFMLGEPGIAKSMLFDQLIDRMVDVNSFKWLLTKFSAPEELFGGPDLKTLKDTGVYRRITDGKLPQAEVSFIDEIGKANSSILNALLKITNEREFDNPGDDPHVPLISLFTASNELPDSSELEALFDRLLVRHVVNEIPDPEMFVKMLSLEPRNPKAYLSLENIEQASREASEVEIPETVYDALLTLSESLKQQNIKVTDRRFKQSISIIKAQAWLNGHTVADVGDTTPLVYVMWRDPSTFDAVRKLVLDLADPMERDALRLSDELEAAWAEFKRIMDTTDNPNTRGKQAIETYTYFKAARAEWAEMYRQAKEDGKVSVTLERLKKRLKEVGPRILHEGMGVESEDPEELNDAIENRTQGY